MKTNLYVIFDKVADEAGMPFDAKTDGVAIRKTTAMIDSLRQQNPHIDLSEYALYHVGFFDTETLKMSGLPDVAHQVDFLDTKTDINPSVEEM